MPWSLKQKKSIPMKITIIGHGNVGSAPAMNGMGRGFALKALRRSF
jgi:hypothetical protein